MKPPRVGLDLDGRDGAKQQQLCLPADSFWSEERLSPGWLNLMFICAFHLKQVRIGGKLESVRVAAHYIYKKQKKKKKNSLRFAFLCDR